MAKLERIYTVPLGEAYETVRNKRVPRAVKMLKAFASRHMKADGEKVLVSEGLNKHLWENSIQRPPRKVKVRIIKDEGSITVYLADEKVEEKKAAPKEENAAPKKDDKAAQKTEAAAAKKAEPAKEEKR
ncbi:MAG: 50S ribosomal protein L31e [Candidatus Micrarchaeota archaeon]